MIRAEKLSRRFGALSAVEGLNLEIGRGEVFGLLGPNGAGKTTTVRMLTALLAPSSGRAWINGDEVGADADVVRRNVGVLTETPGLYARLTARENLRFFGALQQAEDLDARIERYLRLLGLWPRRDDLAGGFSKGMRQKLAIARALLHEPPVLFLDEPTAALDPSAAKVVRDVIRELQSGGRTIVICTHNLPEAEALCDRIGVLKQRLLAVDAPAGLRARLGGSRIRMQLARTEAGSRAVLQALGAMAGVTGIEEDDEGLLIQLADVGAMTPRIVRAAVAAGAEILSVGPVEASLEAVYFDVIEDATVQEGA